MFNSCNSLLSANRHLSSFILTNSHNTIPAAVEIFNECFIPNCGISIQPSHSQWLIALHQLLHFQKPLLFFHLPEVCRMQFIAVLPPVQPQRLYNLRLNSSIASAEVLKCFHVTVSSAPSAVFFISLWGLGSITT